VHNIPHTEETKLKISKANKGKPSNFLGKKHTEETRKKISESLIGRTVWNKGLKLGISPKRTGKYFICETCGKEFYRALWQINRNKQKYCCRKCMRYSEASRKKMSESHKGKSTWNKGLTKLTDKRINYVRPTVFKSQGKCNLKEIIRHNYRYKAEDYKSIILKAFLLSYDIMKLQQ